jgi:integral membrane sensor domain MASE1
MTSKNVVLWWVFSVIGVLLFTGLIMYALDREIDIRRAHNAEQLAECKRLGGFAKTRADGFLEACTFPPAK